MQSQGNFSELVWQKRLKKFSLSKWESLTENQKAFAKKAFQVLTYKWRWQIAMNIPYLAIFALDRTVPSVHSFNMALLTSVTSKIPVPAFISSWIGLGS